MNQEQLDAEARQRGFHDWATMQAWLQKQSAIVHSRADPATSVGSLSDAIDTSLSWTPRSLFTYINNALQSALNPNQ